ncbi:MAG: hypothetical protein WD045_16410 [Pirellulaceae bacterium]
MSKRRRSDDDDISLFPFLSVVASVIGVLTMMIATIALSQTDSPDVALIEQYEQAQKNLAKADEELENLKREIAVSHKTVLEMRDQKRTLELSVTELEALLSELEQIDQDLAEQERARIVIPEVSPQLRETIADMQAQHKRIQEQIAQLEKQLNEQADRSEAQVTILPQGTGQNYKPLFVECAADAVVMHHLPEPKRVRSADVVKDEAFIKLLETAANSKDHTIIFLMRSDGLATFRMVKKICDDRDIRNGKIPVVGKGRIDLSVFAQAGDGS